MQHARAEIETHRSSQHLDHGRSWDTKPRRPYRTRHDARPAGGVRDRIRRPDVSAGSSFGEFRDVSDDTQHLPQSP